MKKITTLIITLIIIFTTFGISPAKADMTQEVGPITNYKVVGYPDIQILKSNVKIYIEGKFVDFEKIYNKPIIIVKGRVMLPVRAFVYYITNTPPNVDNKNVVYYWPNVPFETDNQFYKRTDGLKTATWIMLGYPIPGTNDRLDAQVLQNFQYAVVYYKKNGSPYSGKDDLKTYKMDIPPLVTDIDGGTAYLPLRMQAYLFGYGVKFDEKNNTVYISKDIPMEFGNGIEEVKNEPQYWNEFGQYASFYPKFGFLWQSGKIIELHPWDGR